MTSYLKLALKVLTRRKFFTFISLFGISLTLVVLVIATAMLDDVFEPHAPQSRFDRVLVVTRVAKIGPQNSETTNPGYGLIHDFVLNLPGIERASAFTSTVASAVYRNGSRVEMRLRRTDADYWKILDFHFLEGRPFTADEVDRTALVAVISETMRAKLFDGAAAVGRTFELDGQRFRVTGVVPAVSLTRDSAYADVWTPVTTMKSDWRHQFMGDFEAVVLARKRSDFAQLKSEFQRRVKTMPIDDPHNYNEIRCSLDTPFEALAHSMLNGRSLRSVGDPAPLILRTVLVTLALLFMALPSLNLVTLNLSRILERAPEIGVRKAFGAARGTLVLQFVIENVVLTLIGGVVAFVLAIAALAWINHSGIIENAQFTLNARVFGWGVFTAALFGVVSGVYPAWRMSRLHPVVALRGGAR
jgi:putative ABC transport system permease protein